MTDEIRPAIPLWIRQWSEAAGKRIRVLRHVDSPRPGVLADVTLALPDHSIYTPPRGVVMVALRDLPDEEAVLAIAADAAAYIGATLAVRHAVPLCFAERSVGLGDAVDHGHLLLAAAHDQLATAHVTLPVVTELRRVRPHELVGEDVEADLLVLGGARPGFGKRLGLVARSAAQHAPCPVMLVGRPSLGTRRFGKATYATRTAVGDRRTMPVSAAAPISRPMDRVPTRLSAAPAAGAEEKVPVP